MNFISGKQKKGQLNLEFLGGSILFFAALIFVINTAFNALPQYSLNNKLNEMEANGISLSTSLINEGYWSNNLGSGSDWENHIDEVNFIKSIGLTSNKSISLEKINALGRMQYEDVKRIFQVRQDFWIEIEEFLPLDTYNTIDGSEWGEIFSFSPHTDFESEKNIRYGNLKSNYFFLIGGNNTYSKFYFYNKSYFKFNLLESFSMSLDGNVYNAGINSGWDKNGKVVILKRSLLDYGREEPGIAKNTISYVIYSSLENSLVKITLFLWSR